MWIVVNSFTSQNGTQWKLRVSHSYAVCRFIENNKTQNDRVQLRRLRWVRVHWQSTAASRLSVSLSGKTTAIRSNIPLWYVYLSAGVCVWNCSVMSTRDEQTVNWYLIYTRSNYTYMNCCSEFTISHLHNFIPFDVCECECDCPCVVSLHSKWVHTYCLALSLHLNIARNGNQIIIRICCDSLRLSTLILAMCNSIRSFLATQHFRTFHWHRTCEPLYFVSHIPTTRKTNSRDFFFFSFDFEWIHVPCGCDCAAVGRTYLVYERDENGAISGCY